MASVASSSSLFLLSGVVVDAFATAFGVRWTSRVLRRLASRFDGVCGATAAESLPLSLLYSLYLLARLRELVVHGHAWHRVLTYVLVRLDIVAPCLSAIILRSKLLLPLLEIKA